MGNGLGANRAKHGWRIGGHRQTPELPVKGLWRCAGWQLQQTELCGEKDSRNETARRTPVSVAVFHVSLLCATKQLRMHTVGGAASSLLSGCFPVPAIAIITDPSPRPAERMDHRLVDVGCQIVARRQ